MTGNQTLTVKLAIAPMCIVAFFGLLGWAGDIDYCDQVILRMSQEEYDSIKALLTEQGHGREPSERDIAHWWGEHHKE